MTWLTDLFRAKPESLDLSKWFAVTPSRDDAERLARIEFGMLPLAEILRREKAWAER